MNSTTPRCLFLSTVNPASLDVGKKIVVHGLCSYLFEKHGDQNFLMASTDDDPRPNLWSCHKLPSVRGAHKARSALFGSLLSRRLSLQEAVFHSAFLGTAIADLIAQFKPDLVIYDTVRLGQYMLLTRGHRKVLYLEDLFSLRYRRTISAMHSGVGNVGSPLGNFGKNLPGFAQQLIQRSRGLQRWLLKWEAGMVERSERAQSSQADLALLISSNEVEILRTQLPQAQIEAVPPRLKLFNSTKRAWHGLPEFVFLGALNLPHNLSAIEYFLEAAMPMLIETYPTARVRIIGKHAPPTLVQKAASFGDRVVLDGFVPDLAPILSECCAMIVPLLFGSGVKLKVIEAMPHGVPIISTEVGVEGVPFKNGIHGVLEDDLKLFPQAMIRLLDADFNQACSTAVAELYDKHYAPVAVDARYAELFGT